MDNLMEKALHSMVYEQFERWESQDDARESIENGILYGCGKEDSMEIIYVKMLFNAMKISVEISAKIILEILLTSGLIKPADERQLRKEFISIVKERNPESGITGDEKED